MKLKKWCLLCIICFQFSFSQEKDLDSIKALVEVYKKRDTTRVQLLNKVTKYYSTRNISKNESILNEAIEISEELNYTQGLCDSYSNLTSFHVQSGNYDKALSLALKTKKLQNTIKDLNGLIYTNSSIARIYTHLEKPDKAIAIQLENLALLKNSPKVNMKAQIHFYLASAYSEMGKYDDSEQHYKSARQIAEKLNFKTGVAIANSSLGILENKRKNYEVAIQYLKKSLVFFKSNKQNSNIAHSNLELAVAYANMGQINEAIVANNEAITIYKKQNNYKNLSRLYLEQSDYYKRKKDYLNSSKFLEEHYKVKDSIFAKDKVAIIEEMQTKYETEKTKREKEVAEQQVAITQLESQKNKNLFFGAIVTIGLLLLASLLYFQRIKTKKKSELIAVELEETRKRLVIEKQYRNSELKALKSQMNPHFIFNALTSIQDYIVHNEQKLARKYLVKFSRLIRIYLEHSQISTVCLNEEITALNLYLELEKDRFQDSLTYTIIVEDNIDADYIQIPTFLVQPYVENAIKHGLLHRSDERILKISFNLDENTLNCTIRDNGIGRVASAKINSKRIKPQSFSSEANQQRIDLLNKTRVQPISLVINDNYDKNSIAIGTSVVLTIPLEEIRISNK